MPHYKTKILVGGFRTAKPLFPSLVLGFAAKVNQFITNSTYEAKLKLIGSKTKAEERLEKDKERESQQFGLVPSGPLRDRVETSIVTLRSDPFPDDMINAYTWADNRGFTHKYVRTLIKSREGSLPLVGGTLQYSEEGLNSLYRADVQARRERGLKKSAAARFKAEQLKLAKEELERLKANLTLDERATQARLSQLEESNRELNKLFQESELQLQELVSAVQVLEDLNADLEEEINQLKATQPNQLENQVVDVSSRTVSASRQARKQNPAAPKTPTPVDKDSTNSGTANDESPPASPVGE